MNLWLVGLMGVGKSTIGRLVATTLEMGFVDTDAMVEKRAEATIPQIWLTDGEQGFRELEAEAVQEAAKAGAVVSTGGGAPLMESNRRTMTETGRVVWLRASVPTLEQRVVGSGQRPLLETSPTALRELAGEREPIYRSIADMTLDTGDLDAEAAAARVVAWWK